MKLILTSVAAVAAALVAAAPASSAVYIVTLDPVTAVPAFPNTNPQRTSVAAGADQIYYQFTTSLATTVAGTFQSPTPTFQFAAPFTLYIGQTCSGAGCTGGTTVPFNASSSPSDPGTSQAGFNNLVLGANSYTLMVQGTAPSATSVSNSFSFSAATVPEPATWGLMLVGFGAIGGALRTSRRKVVFA